MRQLIDPVALAQQTVFLNRPLLEPTLYWQEMLGTL